MTLEQRKNNKNRHIALHQSKKLNSAKETINRAKRLPMEWEKIFTNLLSSKGLLPKIFTKRKQLLNRHISKKIYTRQIDTLN
jgi:hypothetical protein